MAADRPWFGWGLDTYGVVFRIYNTFPTPVRGGFKPYYREAHNDWLQSLAETGFVGTMLLALLALVPLARTPWRDSRSPLPRYLLAGCGLVLLYATFEFPFANPSVMIGFWSSLFVARRYLVLDAHAS
jgi:O-antigen ligase